MWLIKINFKPMKKSIVYMIMLAFCMSCAMDSPADKRKKELENIIVNSPTITLGIFAVAMDQTVSEGLKKGFEEAFSETGGENTNSSDVAKEVSASLDDMRGKILEVKEKYTSTLDSIKKNDAQNYNSFIQLEAMDNVLKQVNSCNLEDVLPTVNEELTDDQIIHIISYLVISEDLSEDEKSKMECYMNSISEYNMILESLKTDKNFAPIVNSLKLF